MGNPLAAGTTDILALLGRHLPDDAVILLAGFAIEDAAVLRQALALPNARVTGSAHEGPVQLAVLAVTMDLAPLAPNAVLVVMDDALALARAAARRFGPGRDGVVLRLAGALIMLPQGADPGLAAGLAGLGATPAEAPPYAYQLRLEESPSRMVPGSHIMIRGWIANLSEVPLEFIEGEQFPLLIGARVLRDGVSAVTHEPRARPSLAFLPRGAEAEFTLHFRIDDPIPGPYTLFCNLLREGSHWAQDRGHPGVEFPFTLGLLEDLPEDPPADLRLLAEVLHRHDFVQHEMFRALRRPPPAPSGFDHSFDALLHAPVVIEQGCPIPITRLMMHLRASLRLGQRFHLRSAANRFEFLCWYVREAAAQLGFGALPVPPALVAFLNADALPEWTRTVRMSQLMLREWQEAPGPGEWLDPDHAGEVAWWWAHRIMPGLRLDPVLMPDHVLERLAALQEGAALLSAYAHRLHAETPALRERFALENPADQVAYVFDRLISPGADALSRKLLGEAAAAWFAERIGGEPGALTRMEFLVAGYAGQLGTGWRTEQVQAWFDAVVRPVHPALAAFAGPRPAIAVARPPRVSVVGVGMELRMTIAALARIGIRPWLRDPHRGVAAPADGVAPAKLLRDVAIIHLNASDLPQILATQSAEAAGRLTIGFFPWELEVLPESHRLALELVDEIWVPTACLQRSYAAACDKPVINMGKGIELPAVVPPFPRAALGLAADAFVFMTGFDFHASLERKNPWALVQAFQLAFPDDDGVALLIKTTDEQAEDGSDPYDQWRRLSDAAARDPRIHLMVQQQEFDDVFGLIGMADCVVSAHRAEGFGDLPAFGLLLGKPVIVTDYSGTQEYCSEATSFPVRCSLKPIEPPEFIHAGEGSLWAEIDIAHLAERMRQVRADPQAAAARMAAGQALLRERFSLDALAARYTERLSALGVLE